MNGSRLVALTAGALLLVTAVFGPATTVADTGSTNTIKVLPATTTVTPAGTGSSFTVNVVANGALAISGAGTGLTFDTTKLQLTDIAKSLVPTDAGNPPGYAGFPAAANKATFIASANTAGGIPVIGWSFFDGASSEPANVDHGIFSATFSVIAVGDSTLSVVPGLNGGILDGTAANYGQALTLTPLNGRVVNTAAPIPPTASLATPSTIQLGTSMTVAWAGTAGSAAIQSYDVRYRKASWKSTTFSEYATWTSATTALSSPIALSAASTYCFSVRARDVNALTSNWTADKCTISPADDRSLTKSGTWSSLSSSKYYRGTYRQSKTLNASLSATSVKFKKLYVVASTCSTCGSMKVYLGSTLLKTISLKGATAYKRTFLVYSGSTVKSGTVKIKVSASGKYDRIDGLAVGMY